MISLLRSEGNIQKFLPKLRNVLKIYNYEFNFTSFVGRYLDPVADKLDCNECYDYELKYCVGID